MQLSLQNRLAFVRTKIRRLRTKNRLADETLRCEFDADYYLRTNPDVHSAGVDPFVHFMEHGWKEGRNPRADFDTFAYLRHHIDVALAGMNPFRHYIEHGRAEGREVPRASEAMQSTPVHLAKRIVQDDSFPREAERHDKIMVILVPEHNEMSGGIYSFFSIARAAYQLRHKHDYMVLLMTRPNRLHETYIQQRNFRNSETVFRFEQIVRCREATTVYLHVPEYAAPTFVDLLEPETLDYLRARKRLYINILNQKIDIMPERHELEDIRALADELTQSVAHHAYFGQSFADRYATPLLLLPAYTDLSPYDPLPAEEKQNLIIYSPDEAPWKERMLETLAAGLPDYELREIRNINFDTFMDLATRCRFSITFGEGFDGYLAQPIYQGGVGFAVYNQEFFPSDALLSFDNIFASEDEMLCGIIGRIRAMETDLDLYRRTNERMIEVYNSLYSRTEYLKRVEMLLNRQFEIKPLPMNEWAGGVRI